MNEISVSMQSNFSADVPFADVQPLNATDWTFGIPGGAMKEHSSWVWALIPGEGGSIW